ncbi:pentapeptide repeat-containing protein [Scytonema sp. NUACC26]|uniref:pentapeptide repeat-containing protein n=1 Tax=Scytonema sp. NUACC26 TaxID=3140176 RepID=UPI0038B386DD
MLSFNKPVFAKPSFNEKNIDFAVPICYMQMQNGTIINLSKLCDNPANPTHIKQVIATYECPGCNLRGANLAYADLTYGDLSKANLSNANLRGTKLVDADLSEANLMGADLRGANLRGADLKKTKLNGANLKGAIMPDGSVYK